MGLSYAELMQEPADEIAKAHLIWSLEAERDTLKAGGQSATSKTA